MNKDLDRAVGETLRRLRTNSGLTQHRAAKALGVSQPTINRWETGSTPLTLETVVSTSVLYGSTPAAVYSAPEVQEAQAVSEATARDEITERAQSLADEINNRQRQRR